MFLTCFDKLQSFCIFPYFLVYSLVGKHLYRTRKKCKSERPIFGSRFCNSYGTYAWMPLKFAVSLLIVLRDEQEMHQQKSVRSIMSFEEIVPNEQLRRARDLRGWTQADLAEALGTDFETVSRWERGITVPSSYYREKLCTTLGKTAEELGLRSERLDLLTTSTRPYVFLASSFADAELEFVARLKADLQTRAITILSSRAVKRQVGANINKALQEAVRAAQVVLVVASPAARSSRHVQEALQLAKIYQRPISAIWIAGESWQACMPKDSDTPYTTIDGRRGYDPSLLDEIAAMLERVQLAPYMPTPGHTLTLRAYHEIGGVKGALVKHAEATYAALPSEEHRRLARALFVRLIDPGVTDQDTTYRRAALAEFVLDDPTRTRLLRETIDTFMAALLLTTDTRAGFATVEVSHEALIREWPRLSDWLHVAREDIHQQQMISEDTAEWEQHGEPTDRLYRGSQLKEAQAWARRNFPSKKEAIFLRAGAVQRLRSLLTAMLVVLLLLSTTSVAGWTLLHQPQPPDPTRVTTLADSGPGSLRWAIENAPAGSTITFAPRLRGGTILLTGGDLQFVKNLALRGPGADVLAISGGERGYVVHVTHDVSVSITGLAFKDSKFRGNSPSFITNEGKLILSKSMVSNNRFYSDSPPVSEKGGGGIYNAGTLSLIDSMVSTNESESVGGGIYNAGTLSLIDSTMSGNTARGDGGGIFNKSSHPSDRVSLTNSTVSGNTAQSDGGGIENDSGALTLTNSTVSGNTAQSDGGGIENDSGALTLTNSTVSGNTARGGSGGGIYSLGMLMLTNTTVANNIAQSSGGGIYKAGNQAELTFCTIYGNRATKGGGIAIVTGVDKNGKQTIPGFIKITNSIVAVNSSAMSPDIAGQLITGGYNLIQNLAGATVADPDHKHSTDLPGMTVADVHIDSELRDNGEHTQTLALFMNSPARDRIPLDACSVDGISTDQRGVHRPDDDETACDIGAYESTD